jgi:adenine phosphoribosyltransferase
MEIGSSAMPIGTEALVEDCIRHIRDVPDFPKPGVVFKDITPLLRNGTLLRRVVDHIAEICEDRGLTPDVLACPEARGFIFGAALAYRLGVGFVPIRKPRKLPYRTNRVEYALEYGTDAVEMHVDAITRGQEVVLVDDLLATGGTTAACAKLIESVGAVIGGCVFLIELDALKGRRKLERYPTYSLIHF